ncbi:hypothetical protein Dxin01_02655 [Deinococcus xinjiangensis]|uniref:N-methyl-transferase-related protein n=1 Tax=Deinococcus xinjiangensis TaxID=457454 RepID=A0ABP9VFR6_9DEIO
MAHWAKSFYDFQDQVTHCYSAPIHHFHHEQARKVSEAYPQGRVLELGSGGGQFAVAAALRGLSVTALELRPAGTAKTLELAYQNGAQLQAITGDFYTADVGGPFDLVCYWDGFGIGEDTDQQRLLSRIARWLSPAGHALIEIYTPWYWEKYAGYSRQWEGEIPVTQTYAFEAEGCRMTDTYAALDGPIHTQSLRCYSPADLRLLMQCTGLSLLNIEAGGKYDPHAQIWTPNVALNECLSWTATLGRGV